MWTSTPNLIAITPVNDGSVQLTVQFVNDDNVTPSFTKVFTASNPTQNLAWLQSVCSILIYNLNNGITTQANFTAGPITNVPSYTPPATPTPAPPNALTQYNTAMQAVTTLQTTLTALQAQVTAGTLQSTDQSIVDVTTALTSAQSAVSTIAPTAATEQATNASAQAATLTTTINALPLIASIAANPPKI